MEYVLLASRVIFGGYFILNGYNHIRHSKSLAGYAGSKGVPSPRLAVIASGLLILLGGAGILLGAQVALSVAAIVLFLVPVTFVMHAFWKSPDPQAKMSEYIAFTKNIALIGGALAYLFIAEPWPLSLGL